jgi:hypothetical protein
MNEILFRLKRKYFPATVSKLLEFGNQRSAGFGCKKLKIVFSLDGETIYKDENMIGTLNFENPLTADLLNRRVCSYWLDADGYFVIKVFKWSDE